MNPRQIRERLLFIAGSLLIGITIAALSQATTLIETNWHPWLTAHPLVVLLAVPPGFMLLSVLTRRYFAGSEGSGIPQTIAHLVSPDPGTSRLLTLRIAIAKFWLTLGGIGLGASAGREGPSVHIGAALMHWLGRLAQVNPATHRSMVVAGGAAGIAAAFNTPLAGVAFAIEELSNTYESKTNGLIMLSVLLAGLVAQSLLGSHAYLELTARTLTHIPTLTDILLIGLVTGLCGGLFARAFLLIARREVPLLGTLMQTRPWLVAGLGGLITALLYLYVDAGVMGTGHAETLRTLNRQNTDLLEPLFKAFATLVTFATGIPGGLFAPALMIGADIGNDLSFLRYHVATQTLPMLGMTGFLSGLTKTPLTATIIIMEMTDTGTMTAPLLAVAGLAYLTSRAICNKPLYHELSHRYLGSPQPGRSDADT